MTYHLPVLLNKSVELLITDPDGIYVDVTFGGGGHSKKILQQMGENARLFGFDQDQAASKNALKDSRFTFVNSNFSYLKNYLKVHGVSEVEGVLADLGVSSHQFDTPERGFSFRFDARLDMRMDQEAEVDAEHILNVYSAEQLQSMFSLYGEVRNAKSLALRIVEQRNVKELSSVNEFLDAIDPLVRGSRVKYLARVFQALRIEVNQEMQALESMLQQSLEVLKSGGRLVVISYHSLEDRMVKNFFKTGNVEGRLEEDDFGNKHRPFKIVSKKPIVAEAEENKANNRARSAKLRIAEKI